MRDRRRSPRARRSQSSERVRVSQDHIERLNRGHVCEESRLHFAGASASFLARSRPPERSCAISSSPLLAPRVLASLLTTPQGGEAFRLWANTRRVTSCATAMSCSTIRPERDDRTESYRPQVKPFLRRIRVFETARAHPRRDHAPHRGNRLGHPGAWSASCIPSRRGTRSIIWAMARSRSRSPPGIGRTIPTALLRFEPRPASLSKALGLARAVISHHCRTGAARPFKNADPKIPGNGGHLLDHRTGAHGEPISIRFVSPGFAQCFRLGSRSVTTFAGAVRGSRFRSQRAGCSQMLPNWSAKIHVHRGQKALGTGQSERVAWNQALLLHTRSRSIVVSSERRALPCSFRTYENSSRGSRRDPPKHGHPAPQLAQRR